MLDKGDLQAIQTMLEAMEQRTDKKLEAMEQRTDKKLETMEQRIMQGVAVLMDAEFKKQYHLLIEAQENALTHAATDDDIDIVEGRLDDLDTITAKHTLEIESLKIAN